MDQHIADEWRRMKQNLHKLLVMRAPFYKMESLSFSFTLVLRLNEEQELPAASVLEVRAQVFSSLRTFGPAHNPVVVVVVVIPFVPRSGCNL